MSENPNLADLDFDNQVKVIPDAAKTETGELRRRVSELMVSLINSNRRGTVSGPKEARLASSQRNLILLLLKDNPCQEACLQDSEWLDYCWSDAVSIVADQGMSVTNLPAQCLWKGADMMADGWPNLWGAHQEGAASSQTGSVSASP